MNMWFHAEMRNCTILLQQSVFMEKIESGTIHRGHMH